MPKKLIALVATAVMVDGARTVIQPGEELPDLPEHDERALLAAGSAEDPAAREAAQRKAKKEEERASAEFKASRERVQAAAASTAADEGQPGASAAADGKKS